MFFKNTSKSKTLRSSLSFLIAAIAIVPTMDGLVSASSPRQDIDDLDEQSSLISAMSIPANIGLAEKRLDYIDPQSVVHSPLYTAVMQNNVAEVRRLLIEEHVPVNALERYARRIFTETALHKAAREGYTEVVRQLLQCPDIDVNARNNFEQTPLHVAAGCGHVEVVKLLIARDDTLINVRDNEDCTPLHTAVNSSYGETNTARCNYSEIVRILLEQWPRVVQKEHVSKNEFVDALEEWDNTTPLMFAASTRNTNIALSLIHEGANVNAQNDTGDTPLCWAIQNGDYAMANLLILHHADVNVRGRFGLTPLQVAVSIGNDSLVALLLGHGADINAQNDDKETALHFAAIVDDVDIARQLLEAGADVNIVDKKEHNPEFLAISQEMRDVLNTKR